MLPVVLATLLALDPAVAPTPPTLPPPPAPEVVVVGERMRRLKLATRTDRRTGVTRCVVKRQSGDPAFDARMCGALLACAATVKTRPQMEACMTPPVRAYAEALEARHEALKADPPK